jgi:hypothetical protein
VSFFEADPPEPPSEPEYRPPAWIGPPHNVLPRAVALNLVLVRNDRVAVSITDARGYPDGLAFGLAMVCRHTGAPVLRPRIPPLMMGPGDPDGPRLGVGFSDGRRAVSGGRRRGPGAAEREIALVPHGGGGSDGRWEGRMWLWPLPPDGALTFAFAWPEEGVEETTVEVDAGPILSAAAAAVELWPDDRPLRPPPPEGGRGCGWEAYGPG